MRTYLLLLLVALNVACSGVKKTQVAINSGNYDEAINRAVEKLRENKDKKGNQVYILMLEEAYFKANERDLNTIRFLRKDNNPAHLEEIYETYVDLRTRQELIKPLTPLYLEDENRNAKFKFTDRSTELIIAKNELSDYLYKTATAKLTNGRNKQDFRTAWEDLDYIRSINPDFKDVFSKMELAHQKGIDYVLVSLYNDSNMVLPKNLEAELLNFNTYGLDDLWTVYHSNPDQQINYDYEMEIAFKAINITPEQVKQTEIIREKEVKDGWTYVYDRNGNVKKDSLGNDMKIDKFVKVQCNYYHFSQFKSVGIQGEVNFTDLQTRQKINSYPLVSEFIFDHNYADHEGDRRALDRDDLRLLEIGPLPFPTNEQMVYDAGEDLKARIKHIISRQKFNL